MSTDSINCSNCCGGIRYDEDDDDDDADWCLEEVNGAFPLLLLPTLPLLLEDCCVESLGRGVRRSVFSR
jgi:hypothetical protein